MRLLVYLSKLNYWDLNAKVNFLKHTLLLLTTTLKLNMSKIILNMDFLVNSMPSLPSLKLDLILTPSISFSTTPDLSLGY